MRARSGDAAFLRLLRGERFAGVVHSVFERAVNVERADGELFTIAVRDLDDAPNTVVVEASGFAGCGIAPGDAVVALAGRMAVGEGMDIRLEGAKAWEPRLPRYPLRDERLRRHLPRVRAQLRSPCVGEAESNADRPDTARRMAMLLQRQAGLLCDALGRADVDTACAAARSLVGLGPGLTPSGDDFLVGLFAALRLPGGPCAAGESVCRAVTRDLARRTNAISAAALKAAAQGGVRACLQTLLHELIAGDDAGVDRALSPVLAIGSSSGADIAAGMVSGLEVQLRVGGRVPCR